ncbi:MAG: cyclopropane-fatty-acyl-phospholipid synthase family protein [Pseudomonadota bacterium]
MNSIDLAERGVAPDWLIRIAIRRLLSLRLRQQHAFDVELQSADFSRQVQSLTESEIAIETEAANKQHYEVPAEFFSLVLGEHLKYSSGLWPAGVTTLDQAEAAMLARTCEAAQLGNGQRILELGCGWGSLTLWMARHYPESQITAVSNSHSQREWITTQAQQYGLNNVEVLTYDVNALQLEGGFDRVVSVEMFEHVRNYRQLMQRIARWLVPNGVLFVHIFCHRHLMYPFETEGQGNWMGRYFFTGGLMPSADTLLCFQNDLNFDRRWLYNGRHYAKTARAWLDQQDAHKAAVMKVFENGYGDQAGIWFQRWRMFFMACEELFAYDQGQQWLVGHFRFTKPCD